MVGSTSPLLSLSHTISLSFPTCILFQLTGIESGLIASCSFILTDHASASVFQTPDYSVITSQLTGIKPACVKVMSCKETPALSQW